jgi:hypothetical protein
MGVAVAAPWNLAKSDNPHIALWGPWQLLPWLALIACLAWLSREAWKMSLRGVAVSPSLDVGR